MTFKRRLVFMVPVMFCAFVACIPAWGADWYGYLAGLGIQMPVFAAFELGILAGEGMV